jgi:hypothetical protein
LNTAGWGCAAQSCCNLFDTNQSPPPFHVEPPVSALFSQKISFSFYCFYIYLYVYTLFVPLSSNLHLPQELLCNKSVLEGYSWTPRPSVDWLFTLEKVTKHQCSCLEHVRC